MREAGTSVNVAAATVFGMTDIAAEAAPTRIESERRVLLGLG